MAVSPEHTHGPLDRLQLLLHVCFAALRRPRGQSLWDLDTEPKYCENGKAQPIRCLKSAAEAQAYGKQFPEVEKDGVPHVPEN